jgi:Ser/Thr protein kinase RdoA (MazF antagonist)
MPTDQDALLVFEQFAAGSSSAPAVVLGNHGGFSGASLWYVRGLAGPWCMRAWPKAGPTLSDLHAIHRLMHGASNAGLRFVPKVWRTRQGATLVEHSGRHWELTAWMPGQADFHLRPTPARLASACTALAQLHAAWSKSASNAVPCPAVHRRLEALHPWKALVDAGWHPPFAAGDMDPVRPWAEWAWRLLPRHMGRLPALLAPWSKTRVPVQPCLCDIWHDHVLFEGDQVTGLVDYGSIKRDHVAVDLARLLGSLIGDDEQMRAVGIEAYRLVRPFGQDEAALMKVLDETGTVLGVMNWLRWLYFEGRQYADRDAVARRLAALVQRMEGWE